MITHLQTEHKSVDFTIVALLLLNDRHQSPHPYPYTKGSAINFCSSFGPAGQEEMRQQRRQAHLYEQAAAWQAEKEEARLNKVDTFSERKRSAGCIARRRPA